MIAVVECRLCRYGRVRTGSGEDARPRSRHGHASRVTARRGWPDVTK